MQDDTDICVIGQYRLITSASLYIGLGSNFGCKNNTSIRLKIALYDSDRFRGRNGISYLKLCFCT